MKKFFYLATLSLFAAGFVASCDSDPEYDSTDTIEVGEASFDYDNGVWDQNEDESALNFEIDDYIFSHTAQNVSGYMVVTGFTPSKIADTSKHDPLYDFPYAAAAGGGINGQPYLVGYWAAYLEEPAMPGDQVSFNKRTCRIYNEDGDTFEPVSVKVCCNTYLKYAVMDGTFTNKKFEAGDYVKLIAHGVHMDGTETETEYFLVNVNDTDINKCIQSNWGTFNLSSLGKCTGIYFTMESNDTGDYGMNVPSYFCIDQLTVKD